LSHTADPRVSHREAPPQWGNQAQPIREYGERRCLTLDAIYTDAGVSGVTL